MTKQRAVRPVNNDDSITLALIEQRLGSLERAVQNGEEISKGRHDEVTGLLRAMNGRVGKSEMAMAIIEQWRKDHGEIHEKIDEAQKTTTSRIWVIGVADGILAAISGILSFLK